MRNFFEIIRDGLHFNKFEVEGNMAVEYSCPLVEQELGLLSQCDYVVHVLSGKKTWRTLQGTWEMKAGQTLYLCKGAAVIRQSFDEDFCMLGFFLTDDLIRKSIRETAGQVNLPDPSGGQLLTAAELGPSLQLDGYFQSMLPFFRNKQKPLDKLVRLKFRELLLHIVSDPRHGPLVAYFRRLAENPRPSLPRIMESSFCYNLRLEEFARLCHRSLSTFKRDFFNHYQTTPGQWLREKRLKHAASLLANDFSSVTQVAFDSGFEDVSHFSRAFKKRFGLPPSEYLPERV